MALGKKTGGRAKGVPNKINTELKDMIMMALSDAGGKNYLKEQAIKNPSAFMSLLGKVLPMQLAGDPNNPIKGEITVKFLDA